MTEDHSKLKELILYLAKESEDDSTFDDEKLNALLFIIDFESYARYGHSVTGEEYIREAD